MIQFDDHIFQMGWFNHQLDVLQIFVMLRTEVIIHKTGAVR